MVHGNLRGDQKTPDFSGALFHAVALIAQLSVMNGGAEIPGRITLGEMPRQRAGKRSQRRAKNDP